MDLHADLFLAPPQGPLVRLVDIGEGPPRKEVFSDNGHCALDLTLMLGHADLCRIGHEAEEPLHVGIGPIDCRVVDVGLEDARFEVIENNSFRDPAEEGEGPLVTVDPHVDVLMEDEADELVTARGEGHDEGPCLVSLLCLGVVHEARVAEVDLGLLARRGLDTDGGLCPAEGELRPEVALDRRVADTDAVVLPKKPPHLFARHLLVIEELLDLIFMTVNEIEGRRLKGACLGAQRPFSLPTRSCSSGAGPPWAIPNDPAIRTYFRTVFLSRPKDLLMFWIFIPLCHW